MQSEGRPADSPRCPSAELWKGSISEGGDRRGQRPPVCVPQLCLPTGTNVSQLPTCPNLDDPNPFPTNVARNPVFGPQAPSFFPQFLGGDVETVLPKQTWIAHPLSSGPSPVYAGSLDEACPDSLDEAHLSEAPGGGPLKALDTLGSLHGCQIIKLTLWTGSWP